MRAARRIAVVITVLSATMSAGALASAAPVRAELTVPAFPTAHHEIVIRDIPAAADSIRVTYQPDAPVANVDVLDLPAAGGGQASLAWTPARAGIVNIEALANGNVVAAAEVSVIFDGVPPAGILMFLFAATVLLGGASWSLWLLLTTPDEDAVRDGESGKPGGDEAAGEA